MPGIRRMQPTTHIVQWTAVNPRRDGSIRRQHKFGGNIAVNKCDTGTGDHTADANEWTSADSRSIESNDVKTWRTTFYRPCWRVMVVS